MKTAFAPERFLEVGPATETLSREHQLPDVQLPDLGARDSLAAARTWHAARTWRDPSQSDPPRNGSVRNVLSLNDHLGNAFVRCDLAPSDPGVHAAETAAPGVIRAAGAAAMSAERLAADGTLPVNDRPENASPENTFLGYASSGHQDLDIVSCYTPWNPWYSIKLKMD